MGATWKPILQKPYPIDVPGGRPTGFFVLGDTVIALTAIAIYHSVNQGETWKIIANQTLSGQWAGWPVYMDSEALFAVSLPYEDSMLVYNFREKIWKPFLPVVDGDTLKYWEYRILKTAGGLRWIAANGLFYYSTIAEPETWYPFAPLFPFKAPSAIAFDHSNQEMWVGTAGARIRCFRKTVAGTITPAWSILGNKPGFAKWLICMAGHHITRSGFL